MNITVRETGMVKALASTHLLGAGARAASGPLAAWSSRLPYARPVEVRWRSGSGGARMFERGVKRIAAEVPSILGPAIPKGPAAVGGAVRSIQTKGQQYIREYTPVRTGALRASVEAVQRPR